MYFSCKVSKLQYNSLAFVAGFKRATDEGSLPEIAVSEKNIFETVDGRRTDGRRIMAILQARTIFL